MDDHNPKKKKRYDRGLWLESAMDVLASEGHQHINALHLSRSLGVSRGSFYHHFESRSEFVNALLEYWTTRFTQGIIAKIKGSGLPPKERLLLLMQTIIELQSDRHDIPLRTWALTDPKVAEKLRKVDEGRYHFVREIFGELGFQGAELEERTRLFIVSESKQFTVEFPEYSREISDSLEMRLALYTSPLNA